VALHDSQVSLGMSALETFVRIRQFKDRAAEFFDLAAQPFCEEVRVRYLAIADHYVALAEAEMRNDRLTRQLRLERMRALREKSRRAPNSSAHSVDTSGKRSVHRRNAGPAQMVAQANFMAAKSSR
jgi:hypothetical protein